MGQKANHKGGSACGISYGSTQECASFGRAEVPVLYFRQRREWLAQGGKIDIEYTILHDYADSAGTVKGHYFHQDLQVARLIHDHAPERHVDVGSRVDGFVAHVASFRDIEVIDIRPLPPGDHDSITFRQADLMNPQDIGQTDSLSCLHTIEHFGLGRYTDPIDVNGHVRGVENLVSLVKPGGRFYLSAPVGDADRVEFNAHREFHPDTLPGLDCIRDHMTLLRFDYVDPAGNLHKDTTTGFAASKGRGGCGIYTFERHPTAETPPKR